MTMGKMEMSIDEQLKYLGTETGRFLLEIDKAYPDIELYISASNVSDIIKDKCRKIISDFREDLKNTAILVNRVPIYDHIAIDLLFGCLAQLLNVLDEKDAEQTSLYKALKEVVLRARGSASI